jgi:hypothetical protein
MCDVAQGLLQGVCIDALDLATMLPREVFNLTYARVIPPSSKPERQNTLRMPLKKDPHRMHAVNRLCGFQAPSTRDVFDEIQVNEALNRIYRCHNDSDVGAGPQSSPSAATGPGMPVVFHYVFVVAEIVEVKQSVHSDVQYLHEAPKLHHCRDDAVERLPNPLAQVRAL